MLVLSACSYSDSFLNKDNETINYETVCLVVKNSPNSQAYAVFCPSKALDKPFKDYIGKNVNILYSHNSYTDRYKISKIEIENKLIDLSK